MIQYRCLWVLIGVGLAVVVVPASMNSRGLGEVPAPENGVLEAFGYVVPAKQVLVSPKIGGQVVELNAEEGKTFQQGDILARLDDMEAKADLEIAKARLELASLKLDKLKGGATEVDLALAKAEVAVARAELARGQVRLDALIIRAPITGTVLTKKAEVGALINPLAFGVPGSICEMADLRDLELEVDVSQNEIGKVRVGQACRFQLDAFARTTYKGKVSRLLPVADRAKGALTVRVKIEVPDKDSQLRPEMRAVVSFLRGDN